jgi:drug/metabolite transporter (DMT)-like permease
MKKGYLYIALATFFFSSMEVALKLSAGNFNAIQLTFLRFLIGGCVLLPLAARELKKKNQHIGRSEIAFFFLTGFICVVVSMILYQMSVIYAPASVVAVLFSCNSVFVVTFAYLFLREPIHRHTVISILVSFLGMAIIINRRISPAVRLASSAFSAQRLRLRSITSSAEREATDAAESR